MSLVLLCVEALAVYGLVFATHAARDRLTLVPYFALLGVLAAILRWTTDAGILYQVGPLTFLLGSVVFFTAILFGVFLLYIFDGVKAAQIGIYTIVAVSIVSPALAALFQFQLHELDPDMAGRIVLSSLRLYVSSTAAMILDFLFIAVLWELCARHLARFPLYLRIAACLLPTYWLDALMFNVGAFWGEPEFLGILEANLISRAILTAAVCPLLTGYVAWEERRQHHRFTPRNLMAILHRSARRELDLFVAHREIEERKRMEAALRASEERLELALQGGDLGLWDWDLTTDGVIFNARWAGMLGFELRDIEPTSLAWETLVHPDDTAGLRAQVRATLKGEVPSFEVEIRMRGRDGVWRWILNKGKVVSRAADGRALRATGTHLDITRLKATEEALRFSQEMFQLMFEESPMGLILCDVEGRFVRANPAFRNLVNYTEAELLERTYFDISARDFTAGEQEQLLSMQRTGRYGPFEIAYLHRDGSRVPVIANGCLVTGDDGRQYIWSILQDIREHKAAEEAIAAARRYQREIETRIDETLLRGRPPAGLRGVEIAAINVPTEHLDGDFTEFVCLNSTCFDVLVGDVMGKGILGALVSAGAKGHFLRALAAQLAGGNPGAYPRPAALVRAVHDNITRQLIDLDCFLTLCYARFDLQAGTVTFVDCGHTKTIRFRAPEHRTTLLEGENVPIGFLEDEDYAEITTDLRPGDVFFFYSDGLTESSDASGSLFGVGRLIEAIKLHACLDAAGLTAKVLDCVRDFSGPGMAGDDKTCVSVKILDPGAEETVETLTIPADVDRLVEARGFLDAHLERNATLLEGRDAFYRTILAYVEALANVIKHAFAGQTTREIHIELRSSRRRLRIAITHHGRPFRPRCTPLPDPLRKHESGYGLYIMNRSFDNIGYESTPAGQQSIILVKHFHGPHHPAAGRGA